MTTSRRARPDRGVAAERYTITRDDGQWRVTNRKGNTVRLFDTLLEAEQFVIGRS